MSIAAPSAHRANTKIVATVGPACRGEERLAALVEAGVDVFRLNMAHGELAEHDQTIQAIRQVSTRLGRPLAVLVDLAGPKIRLGEIAGGELECAVGNCLRFVRGETSQPGDLTATYERLIDELAVGDRVMLADGIVSLVVEERGVDFARCRVTQSGRIRSRQGINLPGVKISLPAMSAADLAHVDWAIRREIDFVGLSFVRSPVEVRQLKQILKDGRSPARVIAKIEKQEALDVLDDIILAADGVMVARGDLGVEIDVARMAVVQKQIVALCNRHHKPVIIATQMLDSMQRSRRPTRAEATDVANAILDGCDACMLSGETAIGEFPREAVEMMNRIALATEPLLASRPSDAPSDEQVEGLTPITAAVVVGARHVAASLQAKLIVVASHSGATALALAKQRSTIPTVGMSDNEATLRQMCLLWGVVPVAAATFRDSADLLRYVEQWGRGDGLLREGDRVVLLAGTSLPGLGHNMIRVHVVGSG